MMQIYSYHKGYNRPTSSVCSTDFQRRSAHAEVDSARHQDHYACWPFSACRVWWRCWIKGPQ